MKFRYAAFSLRTLTAFICAVRSNRGGSFRGNFYEIKGSDEAIVVERRHFRPRSGTSNVFTFSLSFFSFSLPIVFKRRSRARSSLIQLNSTLKAVAFPSFLPELDQQFPAAVRQRGFVLETEHLQKGARRCRARVHGDVVAGAVPRTNADGNVYLVPTFEYADGIRKEATFSRWKFSKPYTEPKYSNFNRTRILQPAANVHSNENPISAIEKTIPGEIIKILFPHTVVL